MAEKIEIWLVGNTGLRNPNRIQEGFAVFASSPFVGKLRDENEIGFMNLLNEKGIIHNESGKDASGSHARKWRLMFAKTLGKRRIQKNSGQQKEQNRPAFLPEERKGKAEQEPHCQKSQGNQPAEIR